ncbi:hypothetical protein J2Z21_009211 [Streptomyces griseochromogenes]|uniref:Uncharacterized protein n=1 Tax=Streptomyces griseochromogenes TaxID=68214 RepID=A0A1B1APN3_9ACTN|nr:hypothetical protein [Streptomyces griseochromogenes]ANP48537.1 hypothetical protein AVL59_02175 [Streptomyces griseochromogenes]MBP2056194.1 hypothetical protein [Streptomyces griseochromogenes]
MGRRDNARRAPAGARAGTPGDAVHDRRWARDVRDAVRCAGVLLVLLLLVDWGTGRIALWRALLWLALSLLLFLVLFPARVSAGQDWLASRRLLREHRVRTDLLVSVRCLGGVSQRLLLRDAFGARVEMDPDTLVHNPELWHLLAESARKAEAGGLLLCGQTALHRLSARMERETALAVFKASGLE